MSSDVLRSIDSDALLWRYIAPAWLVSIIVHLLVILLLGFTWHTASAGLGEGSGQVLEVQLDMSDRPPSDEAGAETYFEESASTVTIAAATDVAPVTDDSFLDEAPPIDPTGVLPKQLDVGAGAATTLAAPAVGQNPGGGSRPASFSDGRARTGIFGAEAEGFKFVYVFDRSGSMGGSGRSALNAAKAELLASLEDLGDTHQFQIIFYNQHPTIFPLAGQAGRLVFANETNKLRARQFIQGITADGATAHEDALKAALALRPDAIFFLTDADEPSLNSSQMSRIERLNGGRSVVHVIEFGMGPYLGVENFLVRLARENGGKYAYVDISKLGPAR